jgi:hypothetical protein
MENTLMIVKAVHTFVFSFSVLISQALLAADADITAGDFRCITDMKKVNHFYVDNLYGNVEATVKVASSKTGGVYPPGSVVQLVPTEVMVKRDPGFNAATKDWEFFELGVSPQGTEIVARGVADVNNSSGGNCFGCHVKARPEWDMICDQNHGCDPIPLSRTMITAIQKTDPRCPPVTLTEEEQRSLSQFQDFLSNLERARANN